MLLHNLKYDLLSGLRTKDVILWLILFPIALGTMFKVAFGGIYEKTTKFSAIPVAVVTEEENSAFRSTVESIENSDEPFIAAKFTDEKTALKMLSDEKVKGIIYCGEKLSMTVSKEGYEQTILRSFLDSYRIRESIIKDAFMTSPQKAQEVVKALTEEVSSCKEIPLTHGNTDNFVQYFYNLIAMVAMYGSITGLHITMQNQANMSQLGARISCSPASKSKRLLSCLTASFILQSICMTICVTYLQFFLRINLGARLPLIYLSSIAGGCVGVSIGFMIGSIGRLSENFKVGLSMSVSMLSCFFSGLMVMNIKEKMMKIPFFNDLNPSTIISDSLYCLNIYSDYRRFTVKIVTMLAMTAFFTAVGLIFTRRKSYASL